MAIRTIDDSILQGIAEAIQAKDGGGKMYDTEMRGRIEAIPSGGTTLKKTVNFYTFKGLAYSYTAEEAATLTEMPEPPTIEGFTFQKWNGWTVEKVKTWLENHDSGELSVGGLYVTTDGHTRIKMHLREPQMASFPMPFCIQQMVGTVVIDWGDGSTPETITAIGVYSHTWQVSQYPADVVIDVDYTPSGSTKLVLGRAVGSASYGLFNNEKYYASCVTEIEYGTNNDFSAYSATFRNCSHLKTINIPFGFSTINSAAFYGCTNLALTVLPDGVTSIGSAAFQNCTNLTLIVLPDGVTSIGSYAFYDCTSLYFIDLTKFTDPQSIPALANAIAFQGIPAQAQFQFANQTMLDAFAAATNWSTLSSKFVVKGATT